MADATIALLGASNAGKSWLATQLAHLPYAQTSTIDGIARVHVATATRSYTFLDAPSAFVHNAVMSGAHAAVLLIRIEDGALPDTQRHLDAIRHAGVRLAAVMLNGSPDIDVELVELETRDLLAKWELGPQIPFVRGRNVLAALAATLDRLP